jgi:branched-chain amino acid aminotransferase
MEKNLGFVLQPGTQMVTAEAKGGDPWQIVRYTPRDSGINIGAHAAVLHYGRALFEGLKAFRTVDDGVGIFRPDANARRMYAGAQAYGMTAVPEEFFIRAVRLAVEKNLGLIPPSGDGSLYIRPLLMDAGDVMGLSTSGTMTLQVSVNPVGEYFPDGLSGVWLFYNPAWVRTAPGMGGNFKTIGNYAMGIGRKDDAKKHGCGEIIYQRYSTEFVDEAGAMNLFFVKDDVLYTPSLQHGTILPGVTRNSVIQLARYFGYTVIESDKISIHEGFDECFGTGTAAGVLPVLGWRRAEGTIIHEYSKDVGPVTRHMYELITGIQTGAKADTFGWLHRIKI